MRPAYWQSATDIAFMAFGNQMSTSIHGIWQSDENKLGHAFQGSSMLHLLVYNI